MLVIIKIKVKGLWANIEEEEGGGGWRGAPLPSFSSPPDLTGMRERGRGNGGRRRNPPSPSILLVAARFGDDEEGGGGKCWPKGLSP